MKTKLGTALVAGLLFAVVAAFPALAGDATQGPITIHNAWARATPPNAKAGGAFAMIHNAGPEDDQLIGVAAPVAKTVELHTHINDNGVMRMRAVPAIDLPAGKPVALAPGGFHVMLIDLPQPLKEGQSFPLTLTFKKAGAVTVTVDVKPVGSMGPESGMMHDPAMHEQHMKDPEHQKMHEMMHGKDQ